MSTPFPPSKTTAAVQQEGVLQVLEATTASNPNGHKNNDTKGNDDCNFPANAVPLAHHKEQESEATATATASHTCNAMKEAASVIADEQPQPKNTVGPSVSSINTTTSTASTSASASDPATRPKRKPPKSTRGKFEERFAELQEFQKQHDHCRVPHKYTPNLKLGYFVSNIRKFYRNKQNGQPSTLSDAQIQRLEDLGFEWNLHGPLTDFEQRIQGLKVFYAQHGHIRIPATRFVKPLTEKEPNPHWKLGSFISDMRKEYKLYKQGKPSRLNPARIKALEEVGMEWVAKHSQTFEDYVQELKDFYAKHGHFRVANSDDNDNNSNTSDTLKQWVHRVRAAYSKLKQGGKDSDAFLTPERIQALNDIEFDWANDSDHVWNQRYKELKEFQSKHGHCRVPSGRGRPKAGTKDTTTLALAGWIGKQREHYRYLVAQHPEAVKKNEDGTTQIVWPKNIKRYMSLTTERIKKLEELGFQWVIRPTVPTFEERLESLREHKEMFGHVNVRQDRGPDNEYKRLGRWLAELRLEYFKGQSARLTPERLKALEDLGVNWKEEGKAKKESKSFVIQQRSVEKGGKDSDVGKTGTTDDSQEDEQGGRFNQLLKVAAKEKSSADSSTPSNDDKIGPASTNRQSTPREVVANAATEPASKVACKRKNAEEPLEGDGYLKKRAASKKANSIEAPVHSTKRRSNRSLYSAPKKNSKLATQA